MTRFWSVASLLILSSCCLLVIGDKVKLRPVTYSGVKNNANQLVKAFEDTVVDAFRHSISRRPPFPAAAVPSNPVKCEDTLRQIHIVAVHGKATPPKSIERLFPNSEFASEQSWPEGYDQLNNAGKSDLYVLGQNLRTRYTGFAHDDPTEVDTYSDSNDRTLDSAEVLLAGFVQPRGRSVWNQNLNWAPTPVRTDSEPYNYLSTKNYCPAADADLRKLMESEAIVNLNEKNADLLQLLARETGGDIRNVVEATQLFFVLLDIDENERPLPDWLNQEMADQLWVITNAVMAADFGNEKLKRLRIGQQINKMMKNIHDTTQGQGRVKPINVYTVGRLFMAGLLMTLSADKELPINRGSTLVFELHENEDSNYGVKIRYIANPLSDTHVDLTLKACDFAATCSVSELDNGLGPFMPANWADECYDGINKIFPPRRRGQHVATLKSMNHIRTDNQNDRLVTFAAADLFHYLIVVVTIGAVMFVIYRCAFRQAMIATRILASAGHLHKRGCPNVEAALAAEAKYQRF